MLRDASVEVSRKKSLCIWVNTYKRFNCEVGERGAQSTIASRGQMWLCTACKSWDVVMERGLPRIKGVGPQGWGCDRVWGMPLNLGQQRPQRGLRPLTPAWTRPGRCWHSFTMWFPQCWGFSSGVSVVSDQTWRREEDVCAESESKEGKWEKEVRLCHGARDPWPTGWGPQLRGFRSNHGLEPMAPLLFLRGDTGARDVELGVRASLASSKRCRLFRGCTAPQRAKYLSIRTIFFKMLLCPGQCGKQCLYVEWPCHVSSKLGLLRTIGSEINSKPPGVPTQLALTEWTGWMLVLLIPPCP